MTGAALALTSARGPYPERTGAEDTGLDRALATAIRKLRGLGRLRPGSFHEIVRHVDRVAPDVDAIGIEEIAWQLPKLREDLRSSGFAPEVVGRCFAAVRRIAEIRLAQRHHDVQLIGGWVLLNGMIAEMATGEGKTLAATLPACTAALAGIPVHVITVNDYLTARDSKWMRPIYTAMGLTVGAVTHESTRDERRLAYRCDVTYCTNKEIAFDYLRDRLEIGRKPGHLEVRLERLYAAGARLDRLRLRGLCFGIVDEADSVLIDEARTPLIISGPGDQSYESELYRQALAISESLQVERDYTVDFPKRKITLTDEGREQLTEAGESLGGFWNGRLRREDIVRQALTARLLFHRDKHYVVVDDKVQIVDEYTGRVMPGRSWEGGLHQLIETKEDAEVTTRTEVLARISYQRFFRRYLALAGMTGTAKEAAPELGSVYGLDVVRIPTNRKMIRSELATRISPTADAKWAAVVERIRELHTQGRPVLIGTRTVVDSEHLSRRLEAAGLQHRVLNALQDSDEALTIAEAGQRGRITVATNMAGRGTDILLGSGVAELGGLHVIATERHDAGRIDRQLFGRCGRQGDPGTYEAMLSLEDELLETHLSGAVASLVSSIRPDSALGRRFGSYLFRRAQHAAQRRYHQIRRDLLKLDEQVDNTLAFAGFGE